MKSYLQISWISIKSLKFAGKFNKESFDTWHYDKRTFELHILRYWWRTLCSNKKFVWWFHKMPKDIVKALCCFNLCFLLWSIKSERSHLASSLTSGWQNALKYLLTRIRTRNPEHKTWEIPSWNIKLILWNEIVDD